MTSPVRRAFVLLRQHPVPLVGPWLGVCALGFVGVQAVQQVTNRLYPVASLRAVRGSEYVDRNTAFAQSIRAGLIRQGAVGCVELVEYAFKVIALAVIVLAVARIATQGEDSFSAAVERLQNAPGVTATLLKFYGIAIAIGFGTALVAMLPAALIVSLQVAMHWPAQILRWATWISAQTTMLLFVCCIMPFFLDLVWRLQRPTSPDEEVPDGSLGHALRYGAAATGAQLAIALLFQLMQASLWGKPQAGISIGQEAFWLARDLVTALPTIVCVVAIALMMMPGEAPVTEAEAA